MPAIRSALGAALLLLAVGCSDEPATGEVSGTVTVNGQVPAVGSSITFFPADGNSPSAGGVIQDGKYKVRVPVGTARVEIRVPRPATRPGRPAAGPGVGPGAEGGYIEESLPARYNDQSELTFEVKKGSNEKNWELTAP